MMLHTSSIGDKKSIHLYIGKLLHVVHPFLSACFVLLLLTSCGATSSLSPKEQTSTPTPIPIARIKEAPSRPVAVSFTASTSYASALRIISDLGLQLTYACPALINENGTIHYKWNPLSRSGSFQVSKETETRGSTGSTPVVNTITILPSLLVFATSTAANDWMARLKATSDVSSINTNFVAHCPMIPVSTQDEQPVKTGVYTRVTFSSQSGGYDVALDAITNLGFRLADPCYEKESSLLANWHPMGQEQTFASTHMLVIVSTSFNPPDWQTRLTHLKGVTATSNFDMANC